MRSDGELVYYGEPLLVSDSAGCFLRHAPDLGDGGGAGGGEQRSTAAVYSSTEAPPRPWRLVLFQAYDIALEVCHVI